MVTVTIPPNLEKLLLEEALQKGTTVERLTLDVLQERFLRPIAATQVSDGATLADALADDIGAINT
ncbi:MAG: hypothetical protein M3Y56_13130, partial [Armatimonadota bacterium]|nr:hypothetical protein [Armatimonadota bacterium]